MEYQRAARIKNKSLLSLIGERKFEQGQGIARSVGGAISDKFKAKATRFKAALDPLNMVRKITGQGSFGDIATTAAGRLFGRSDKDISYFGGYRRKKKKDPQITSVNVGNVQSLRSSDSTADILGKIYNFMHKTNDEKTKYDEINKSFRQEQMDEDDRRHKELVEAIKGKRPTATPAKKEEEGNGILGFLKKMIDDFLNNPLFKSLMEIGKDLVAFFKSKLWSLLRMALGGIEFLAPLLIPALIGAGLVATLIGLKSLADWWTEKWKNREVEAAREQGGEDAASATAQQQALPNVLPDDTANYSDNAQKYQELEGVKQSSINRKTAFMNDYLGKKGYQKKVRFFSRTPYWVDSSGKEAPEPLIKEASTFADGQLQLVNNGVIPDPLGVIDQNIAKKTAPKTDASETAPKTDASAPAPYVGNAGRGSQGGPTAEQAATMVTTPDIPPVPEPSTAMETAPIVQVNNNSNMMRGNKDKILSLSSPRHRNTDLDSYLASSVPLW